jgi:hypothetical protein
MFTHFARSEPFPLLCDVAEFQVVKYSPHIIFEPKISVPLFSYSQRLYSSSREGVAQLVYTNYGGCRIC